MSGNKLNITCMCNFLRKHCVCNISLEGHDGGRAGPVDRDDGIVKTFLSNNVPLQAIGMSPGRFVWL